MAKAAMQKNRNISSNCTYKLVSTVLLVHLYGLSRGYILCAFLLACPSEKRSREQSFFVSVYIYTYVFFFLVPFRRSVEGRMKNKMSSLSLFLVVAVLPTCLGEYIYLVTVQSTQHTLT